MEIGIRPGECHLPGGICIRRGRESGKLLISTHSFLCLIDTWKFSESIDLIEHHDDLLYSVDCESCYFSVRTWIPNYPSESHPTWI